MIQPEADRSQNIIGLALCVCENNLAITPVMLTYLYLFLFLYLYSLSLSVILSGFGEPHGEREQPHEPQREPHGLGHVGGQPGHQLAPVPRPAAAVLRQGQHQSVLHAAQHVRPAQLPWRRRLRRQVSVWLGERPWWVPGCLGAWLGEGPGWVGAWLAGGRDRVGGWLVRGSTRVRGRFWWLAGWLAGWLVRGIVVVEQRLHCSTDHRAAWV